MASRRKNRNLWVIGTVCPIVVCRHVHGKWHGADMRADRVSPASYLRAIWNDNSVAAIVRVKVDAEVDDLWTVRERVAPPVHGTIDAKPYARDVLSLIHI